MLKLIINCMLAGHVSYISYLAFSTFLRSTTFSVNFSEIICAGDLVSG